MTSFVFVEGGRTSARSLRKRKGWRDNPGGGGVWGQSYLLHLCSLFLTEGLPCTGLIAQSRVTTSYYTPLPSSRSRFPHLPPTSPKLDPRNGWMDGYSPASSTYVHPPSPNISIRPFSLVVLSLSCLLSLFYFLFPCVPSISLSAPRGVCTVCAIII
jgi:hypothetical protein